MTWKINNIEIRNFKFFHEPFTLNVDGKNLLLYGENGCGKSSIYWSFYTHYQACLKQPEQASLKSATIIQYTIKGRFMSR
uniref:ATP-binding protein n=1 Tax=uncultured Prevotella sp. TaxID=159272 RepID=UPI002627146D